MKKLAAGLAMLSFLATPLQAAPAERPCLTEGEFEDFLLIVAPVAVKAIGDQCAKVLPRGEVLRNPDSEMAKNLTAASDEAWPRAKDTLVRLMVMEGKGRIPEDFPITKEMFASLLTPEMGKIISKPEACKPADRLLKLIEPLPPRNVTGMLVQIMALMPDRKPVDFLCTAK